MKINFLISLVASIGLLEASIARSNIYSVGAMDYSVVTLGAGDSQIITNVLIAAGVPSQVDSDGVQSLSAKRILCVPMPLRGSDTVCYVKSSDGSDLQVKREVGDAYTAFRILAKQGKFEQQIYTNVATAIDVLCSYKPEDPGSYACKFTKEPDVKLVALNADDSNTLINILTSAGINPEVNDRDVSSLIVDSIVCISKARTGGPITCEIADKNGSKRYIAPEQTKSVFGFLTFRGKVNRSGHVLTISLAHVNCSYTSADLGNGSCHYYR